MKILLKTFILLMPLLFILNCKKEKPLTIPKNQIQNSINSDTFTIVFQNDTTNFLVHKSSNYNANQATPLVLLLHGTNGTAYNFYDKTNSWYDLTETENIITVYPSSREYNIIEDGVLRKNVTKWNAYSPTYQYEDPSLIRDDVQYIKNIMDTVEKYFNVDEKRKYIVGFSNGGSMAYRCTVEMTDVFAAVVESSGSNTKDTLLNSPNTINTNPDIAFYYQLGNKDSKMLSDLSALGWTPPSGTDRIPLQYFDEMFDTLIYMNTIIENHIYNFGFDSTTHNLSGNLGGYRELKFNAYNNSSTFTFAFIDGMGHTYASFLTQKNWNWLKQFTKP